MGGKPVPIAPDHVVFLSGDRARFVGGRSRKRVIVLSEDESVRLSKEQGLLGVLFLLGCGQLQTRDFQGPPLFSVQGQLNTTGLVVSLVSVSDGASIPTWTSPLRLEAESIIPATHQLTVSSMTNVENRAGSWILVSTASTVSFTEE